MAVRVAMMWPMVLGESRAYGIISVFLGGWRPIRILKYVNCNCLIRGVTYYNVNESPVVIATLCALKPGSFCEFARAVTPQILQC